MGKIITKYKIFESLNMYGSKEISESEFLKLSSENCKNWQSSKTSLFRGQPNLGEYVYTDPTNFYRSSIEDTNIHIELIDGLSSWKEYPSYGQSVIGVSSENQADSYGDSDRATYELIPYDNIKIAVCPYSTIWESFSLGGWGDDIYLVEHFLYELDIDYVMGVDFIKSELEKIDNVYNLIPKNDEFNTGESINSFLERMKHLSNKNIENVKGKDCYDFINDYLFNPVKRKFNLVKYTKNFKIPEDKQIWTNGPVLLRKIKDY